MNKGWIQSVEDKQRMDDGGIMQEASGDTDTWNKLSVRPVLCSGKPCAFPMLICFLLTQTTEKQKGGEGIAVPRLC